jgi:hypothetical protein
MRWMIGSIVDWDKLFVRAYAHIKPGGWLETYEMSAIIESDDGTVPDESACWSLPYFKMEDAGFPT